MRFHRGMPTQDVGPCFREHHGKAILISVVGVWKKLFAYLPKYKPFFLAESSVGRGISPTSSPGTSHAVREEEGPGEERVEKRRAAEEGLEAQTAKRGRSHHVANPSSSSSAPPVEISVGPATAGQTRAWGGMRKTTDERTSGQGRSGPCGHRSFAWRRLAHCAANPCGCWRKF